MSPDQRAKDRKTTTFSVSIHRYNAPPVNCKALNLSPAGLLLETGETVLPIGSLIELHIRFSFLDLVVPSVVIHSNTNCTGVMFREPQQELFKAVTHPLDYSHMRINGRVPLASRL